MFGIPVFGSQAGWLKRGPLKTRDSIREDWRSFQIIKPDAMISMSDRATLPATNKLQNDCRLDPLLPQPLCLRHGSDRRKRLLERRREAEQQADSERDDHGEEQNP
jgi:hypothetical protein